MSGETHCTHHDGLWIPPEHREFNRQVVIRVPGCTIQRYGNSALGAYLSTIRPRNFGAEGTFRHCRNPELVPNRVSIKPEGGEKTVLEVDVE